MFEKVSLTEWEKSVKEYDTGITDKSDMLESYDNILLPRRSTLCSAGYDFFIPFDLEVSPQKMYKVPTGIKVNLDLDENSLYRNTYLAIYPRSSLGFKYGLTMSNTIPIIDSDYYGNPSNEGHIIIAFFTHRAVKLNKGDKFCQGVVSPYYILRDEISPVKERTGGMGSTGK